MIREEDLANEDLGGYRITAELTSHTSSSSFLGESISPETSYESVVIELLYAARTHNEQEQEEIQQKIASLQALRHPHILPILSVGIYKDVPYIISEYLSSGSLYDRFQHRSTGQSMPTKDAFLTLAQVGQALHYAHQQQVIHGSLTSQDVLFTMQNEALVTGFHRHALLLPDEEDEVNALERSIYRAPEQLSGLTSEKSDQYALGCLAYALFTGYQAFTVPSINTPGTYYKTRSLISPARLNSALPLYIEEAILKAMSRVPEQRYPDIDAFLAALGIPPAAGNSDLKETVAILAQIMKGEFPELPTTPVSGIETFDTVKTPIPLDAMDTRDGNLTNSDTFSQVPPDILGQMEAATFSNAVLPNAPTYMDEENQMPFKFQQAYGGSSKSSFSNMGKSFTSRPRRTFAVIICLIVIMIVGVTMLIDSNFLTPSKKSATIPSIHRTSTAHSPTQTSVPRPRPTATTLRTPSSTIGITVPARNATPPPQPTTIPTTVPTPTPTSAPAQVLVALNSFFNNEGIANTPGLANFDGSGYSYPASQLPSGSQINLQGVPYQFPGNAPGTNDNIVAFGQAISLTPGNYRQALLLASSSWGPVSGTVTIQYTDGSTSTRNLTVPDWYSNSGVLNMSYRYTPNRIDNHPVCIYAIAIQLDSTRVANALILPRRQSGPYQNGHIHVFALTLLP